MLTVFLSAQSAQAIEESADAGAEAIAGSEDFAQQGLLRENQGDIDGAISLYETALVLNADCLVAMSHLGRLLDGKGTYERANQLLQRSADQAEKGPGAFPDTASVFLWLAESQWNLGEYAPALECLRKSERFAQPELLDTIQEKLTLVTRLAEGELVDGARAHQDLAKRHSRVRRYDRAIAEAEAALGVMENVELEDNGSTERYDLVGSLYGGLYYYNEMIGQQERCGEYARASLETYLKGGSPKYLAEGYYWSARHHCSGNNTMLTPIDRSGRDPLVALEQLDKAEAICQDLDALDLLRSIRSQRTWALQMAYGMDNEAFKRLRAEDAGDIPKSGDITDPEIVNKAWSEAYYRGCEKNFDGALELLLRLKTYYDQIPISDYTEYVASYYSEVGKRLYTQRADPAEGIPFYLKALEVAEVVRARMGSDEFKRSATNRQFIEANSRLSWLYTELGDPGKAFEYAERYKGRALLDLLDTKAVAAKRGTVWRKEVEQKGRIARLDNLELESNAARAKGDTETLRSIERTLVIEQSNYERLQQDLGVARRELDCFLTAKVTSLDEIRPFLKNATLVNYVLMPLNFNTAVVVTEDGVVSVKLPEVHGRELGPVIERFRREIGVKNSLARDLVVEATVENATVETPAEPAESAAQVLYRLLIEPVKPYLKTELVCFSLLDVLNYVPFEALQGPDGRYFIEDHAVTYVPSASVLKLCMEKGRLGKESVLALGNPNLKNPEFRLANAEEEVGSLAGMFPKVDAYTFDDATESVVKARGREYDILHFACHGELNQDDAMLSALRLTPSAEDDGYLHAGEIFELDLAPSLVVLSACNSGVGELSMGNEIMGLTRAFLYAGAPATIASLWQVDDRSTAILMQAFYRNLATMGKAEALRQAKLETMKTYPSPFHWAPFCLQGDFR